jgi:hypothetical protein
VKVRSLPGKNTCWACKTRWVERHVCFDVFYKLYAYIVKCLQYILNPSLHEKSNEEWFWDRQTKVKAQGLLTSITAFSTLVTFVFARHVLDTIKPLTVKLQKRDNNVSTANKLITEHVERVKEIRGEIDAEFETCFHDAKRIAEELDITVTVPRTCNKQQHRANIHRDNPKEYYKSAVAIPFLDYGNQELDSRFLKKDKVAYSVCSLLPENITCLSDNGLSTGFRATVLGR